MARIGGGYSCIAPAAYNQDNSLPRTMLPFNCPHAVAHASLIERYILWKSNWQKKWNWADTAWHWQHIMRRTIPRTDLDAASLHTYTSSLHTYLLLSTYIHPLSFFSLSSYITTIIYLTTYIRTVPMYLMRSSCACARCAGPVLVPCRLFSKTKNKAQIPAGIMIHDRRRRRSDKWWDDTIDKNILLLALSVFPLPRRTDINY